MTELEWLVAYRAEISALKLGDLLDLFFDLKIEGVMAQDEDLEAQSIRAVKLDSLRKELNRRQVSTVGSKPTGPSTRRGIKSLKGFI